MWAAESRADLQKATSDLATAPVVGSRQTVEKITCVFSENKRQGRWRMTGPVKVVTVFGETELDLREVQADADVVEIRGRCVFGSVKVIVPEGVEVDMIGSAVFSSRKLRLAPMPRLAGTLLVRLHVNTHFGDIDAHSRGPNSGSPLARWLRDFLGS